MKATLTFNNQKLHIDLSKPLDISIPLKSGTQNPLAWYIDPPIMSPVEMGDWIGNVEKGGAVNFNNIRFNPHAHGTHTESVGHISKEFHSVHDIFETYFFLAEVISIMPESQGDDQVISAAQLIEAIGSKKPEAIVIRTLPNNSSKLERQYSNTNWPYLQEQAATFLREIGLKHLLIDLPSVDKEKDEGALLAHRAFWNYPNNPRYNATITELIYVPDEIADGSYVLNLQTAPFVNDAAPSRPVLYKIN